MSPNARAGGAVAGSQPTSTAVHMEPKETLKIYLHIYPMADPVSNYFYESGYYQQSMITNLFIIISKLLNYPDL
jgi:hypothetical protein